MASPRDELARQITPGRFSPDYAGEQTNRGASEVLARQVAGRGITAPGNVSRKTSAAEASYTSPGPIPFTCGNCEYLTAEAAPAEPGTPQTGVCELVEGPYDGQVGLADTCRLFVPCKTYPGVRRVKEAEDAEPHGDADGPGD